MLSQLGPLFRTTFRHAEESDARLAMTKDERHDDRPKKEFDDRPEDPDKWEDRAVVSVAALRDFLTDFLHRAQSGEVGAEAAPGAETGPAAAPSPPVDARAARAAAAYQHSAGQDKGPSLAVMEGLPPSERPDLDAQGIATLENLIADLDRLQAAGVDSVAIQAAGSFLDGLKRGVAEALVQAGF